jgi:hypothetical protein
VPLNTNSGSEDQDTALFKSLEQFVLDNYPNPGRVGCLPRAELEALLDDPGVLNLKDIKYMHIMECAECTRDLIALREARKARTMKPAPSNRKVLLSLCAGVLIALMTGLWIGWRVRSQQAPAVQSASAEQLVDLAAIPTLRGDQSERNIVMFKDAGRFIFKLPPYTPPGKFHVSLVSKEQDEIISKDADSEGEKGHLKLPVLLDISHLSPGEYRLTLRSEHDTAPYFYNITIQ